MMGRRMAKLDRLARAAERLMFHGIEALPWELDNDYEPPKKLA
jgi:hypothetical protein